MQIPSMVVASWSEAHCNAFFYVLAKMQPSSCLQHLVPKHSHGSTLERAAESLFSVWKVLLPTLEQRKEQAFQFLEWWVEDNDKMVQEA